jgi:hypothetical protein
MLIEDILYICLLLHFSVFSVVFEIVVIDLNFETRSTTQQFQKNEWYVFFFFANIDFSL